MPIRAVYLAFLFTLTSLSLYYVRHVCELSVTCTQQLSTCLRCSSNMKTVLKKYVRKILPLEAILLVRSPPAIKTASKARLWLKKLFANYLLNAQQPTHIFLPKKCNLEAHNDFGFIWAFYVGLQYLLLSISRPLGVFDHDM